MNTCDTCKWWPTENEKDTSIAPMGWRECQCPKIGTENKGWTDAVGEWMKYHANGVTYEKLEDVPLEQRGQCTITHGLMSEHPDGALAAAGDYYQAMFHTGPKFGCVHWERKPGDPETTFEKCVAHLDEIADGFDAEKYMKMKPSDLGF